MSVTRETERTRTEWRIDAAHTQVEFAVQHMMIATVRGRFGKVDGRVELDGEDWSRARVVAEIDAGSIDTAVAERDAHLRSADFFDVENHPRITFRSTRVEPEGERRWRLTGELTIRGVTREVVLAVEERGRIRDPYGNDRVAFSATGRIDRQDFGLTWNQALEAGGWIVGNEVEIVLEVQAVKPAGQAAA